MLRLQGPDLFLTRRGALALGAAAGGFLLSPRRARAATRLDITEGNFQPLPIAIPMFFAGSDSDSNTAPSFSPDGPQIC